MIGLSYTNYFKLSALLEQLSIDGALGMLKRLFIYIYFGGANKNLHHVVINLTQMRLCKWAIIKPKLLAVNVCALKCKKSNVQEHTHTHTHTHTRTWRKNKQPKGKEVKWKKMEFINWDSEKV